MLRKMTIKVGKNGWAIIGPTTQNQPSVRSFRANVGPTTVLHQLKL